MTYGEGADHEQAAQYDLVPLGLQADSKEHRYWYADNDQIRGYVEDGVGDEMVRCRRTLR